MVYHEKAKTEIEGALVEIDHLIQKHPSNSYYKSLKNGLEAIAKDIQQMWPLDKDRKHQLSRISAYVARQFDYPEPGDEEYNLWLHIAEFESCIKDEHR